jgi:hypothetical protein
MDKKELNVDPTYYCLGQGLYSGQDNEIVTMDLDDLVFPEQDSRPDSWVLQAKCAADSDCEDEVH